MVGARNARSTPPDPNRTREDRLPVTGGVRRGPRWALIVPGLLVTLLIFLAIADRLAVAYAQDTIATQVQKNGFGVKPDVSIKGFPFLTQVAGRNFKHATMSARNVKVGPLVISSIKVDARGVKVSSSFTSGTIRSVDGTAVVGFNDLTKAAGQPGLKLSAAGPGKVRIAADLAVVQGNATAKVTKVGNGIRVHGVAVEGLGGLGGLGGIPGLGDLSTLDFTVPVTGLPLGMTFQSLAVTGQGISMHVTGRNVAFRE